jgi:hypothetical protein
MFIVDRHPPHCHQPKRFRGMRTCIKKFPLLFEGGVVGRIDYHIFTVFSFPDGVVGSILYILNYTKISLYFTI